MHGEKRGTCELRCLKTIETTGKEIDGRTTIGSAVYASSAVLLELGHSIT